MLQFAREASSGPRGGGERRRYPSDVTDEAWALVAAYLAFCREDAAQPDYALRDVFNALRGVVRTGCQWRYLPNHLPPWNVVYQQAQRLIRARRFETLVEDLHMLLRQFAGRKALPTADGDRQSLATLFNMLASG